MGYCPNCGKEITGNPAFCPECGTKQGGQQPVRRNTSPRGRLHCPSCRSTNLTPVIESSGTIGSVGRISKNIAVTGTNVNNKSFWMCQDCGHKFRNLEDLIAENKRIYMTRKILLRTSFGFLFIFNLGLSLLPGGNSGGSFLAALVLGLMWYVNEKWVLRKVTEKKMEEEKKLRKACFD